MVIIMKLVLNILMLKMIIQNDFKNHVHLSSSSSSNKSLFSRRICIIHVRVKVRRDGEKILHCPHPSDLGLPRPWKHCLTPDQINWPWVLHLISCLTHMDHSDWIHNTLILDGSCANTHSGGMSPSTPLGLHSSGKRTPSGGYFHL